MELPYGITWKIAIVIFIIIVCIFLGALLYIRYIVSAILHEQSISPTPTRPKGLRTTFLEGQSTSANSRERHQENHDWIELVEIPPQHLVKRDENILNYEKVENKVSLIK